MIKFKPATVAFDLAIEQDRLSASPSADNYAGNYMYMGTVQGFDTFKHIDTRVYLRRPIQFHVRGDPNDRLD